MKANVGAHCRLAIRRFMGIERLVNLHEPMQTLTAARQTAGDL